MICKFCGTKVTAPKIHFSTECEKCSNWLHSCVQCELWDSSSESCKSMTTDSIRDREGKNFCDEWLPSENQFEKKESKTSKNKFNSLFGD